MRKISEHINDTNTKKAVVYRDVENDEYVVKFYIRHLDFGYITTGDYFTDDKADAIATALYEVSKP